MKHRTNFLAAITGLLIALLWHLPLLAQTPSTPGQPLSVDTSGRVKRDFKIPSGKTLQWESGSTFRIDDGTSFNIGSTAASAMRTAIGDLNGMKTFTNATNRGSTTPTFVGQIGFQTDDQTFWYGDALSAGQWVSSFAFADVTVSNILTAYTETQLPLQVAGGAGSASFTRAAETADPLVEMQNGTATGPTLRVGSAGSGVLFDGQSSGVTTTTIDKSGVYLVGYGAVGAPGLSFYGDADTGLYRSGANALSIAANGAQVGTFSTTGLSVTGTGTFSGAVSGTTGTFSGAVSGTTGTFSGAVSGTTGTFSGAVSGTTGTFSGAISGASASLTAPLPVASGGTGSATATAARTALGMDVAIFWDQKANRTAGDTITSGAWRKLTLNTENVDTANGFSVASSVVTVGSAGAGTWIVRASVPLYATDYSQIRLRRTSGTPATLLVGQAGLWYSSAYVQAPAQLIGSITVANGDTLELQCYTSTSGWVGYQNGSSGNPDEVAIYTLLSFERQ